MNSDDFEKRLQRQPFREVPREWRAEILSNALQVLQDKPQPSFWRRVWSRSILKPDPKATILLWPSPKAWASLAVVWLLLLIVNVSTDDKAFFASGSSKPAPEKLMAWREQERLLTEILGQQEIPVADKPKPAVPRPRSERQNEFRII